MPAGSVLAELGEAFARYGASLLRGWPWLLGFGLVVGAFGYVSRRGLCAKHGRPATLLALGVAALFAVAYAWSLRWLGDDAFISFRYADNWVRGNGLVFNVGERVEGYTNFLWTALMALGIRFGADPAVLSVLLTLASLAGTIALAGQLVRRLLPEGAPLPGVLAGSALAVNYTFASFGTSGLETVPAAFLALLALERAVAGRTASAGVLGILAALAHPDHLLLYAGLGAALALGPAPRVRRMLLYAAPFALVFVPYYLARFRYYGDFFPNTYYAKSAGLSNFSQGLVYLGVSALAAGLLLLLPLATWAVFLGRATLFGRYVSIALPLYFAYVAKIGGDFMLGRLLCVALPSLFVAAELGFRELLAQRSRALMLGAGLAFTLPALPNGLIPPQQDFHSICDERSWYPLKSLFPVHLDEEFSRRTDALLQAFARVERPPRLGFCCVGIMGYRTGYPLLDMFGLTSREVARVPIRERGRPGHEKFAAPGHVFAYDADFASGPLWPAQQEAWAKLRIGAFEYTLAKFDPKLAGSVSRSAETALPDIEQRIRSYSAAGADAERRACDRWFFDQIYFSHGGSDELRRAFTHALVEREPELAGLEALLTERHGERYAGFTARRLFGFDDFREFTRQGKAFGSAPAREERLGQSHVFGQRGSFANSFHPTAGDDATGTLVSPTFTLKGEALTFRVGGGKKRGRAEVRLVVDDRTVRSATGCDSEILGRRVFPIAAQRGSQARLEFVDKSRDGWGHLTVDEVIEWTKTE